MILASAYKNCSLKSLIVAVLLLGTLGLFSCEDGGLDASTPTPTIDQELYAYPQLSQFAEALKLDSLNYRTDTKSSIQERLANRRVIYTVFAPTNDAITSWLSSQPTISSLNDLSKELLHSFLGGHITQGGYLTSGLSSGTLSSLHGNELNFGINTDDNTQTYTVNTTSSIIVPDIRTSNGLLQILDEVLDFRSDDEPRLNKLLASRTDLRTLAEQLARPALKPLLDSLRNTLGKSYTLFAPTNTAFTTYLQENNLTDISEVSDNDLFNLLSSHIISGRYTQADFEAKEYITLSGSTIAVEIDPELTINGIIPNQEDSAENGVVYTIATVLPLVQ